MSNHRCHLLFLAWISYLLASSLLLYTEGFFLNRTARTERSNCSLCETLGDCEPSRIFKNIEDSPTICLPPRSRVVLLIIDALKYEFADWHDNVDVDSTYHLNKLPVIRDLSRARPNNTRLFKFIADPPTTTMQRIKALTTGTLPTFIDAASNFATETINEDNLVEQVTRRRGGVVFAGDDTWTSLFPGKFLRQFPSPSFHVWDLDTVDRQVRDRMAFEIEKKDWSLLIAHTLGVDHCGHKYGPYHPEMARKLGDADRLIAQIVEALDDDTALFVIGDHGMTASGDHGGESPDEVEAAMFVYSKLPLFGASVVKSAETVNQIDLVPTIASILGIPVPFSNIGALVPECLPRASHETLPWFVANALWRNVVQIRNYVAAYSSENFLFDEEELETLEKYFDDARKDAENARDEASFKKFFESSRLYLKTVRDSCAEVWIQFDPGLMSKGLIIFFSVLFFVYILATALDETRTTEVTNSAFILVVVVVNTAAVCAIYALRKLDFLDEFKNASFFATGSISVLLLALIVAQNWDSVTSTWYYRAKRKSVDYAERGILTLAFCGLFSNSYIVEEDKVTLFLLVATIALTVYKTYGDGSYSVPGSVERKWRCERKLASSRYLERLSILLGFVACAIARVSSLLWRCREEQNRETCTISTGTTDSSSYRDAERTLLVVSVVALATYVTVVTNWSRNCERLSEFLHTTNIVRYCYGVIAVTVGCYWVYERLPKDFKVKVAVLRQINALPGIAYFFASLGIFVVYCRPLGVSLLPRRKESTAATGRDDHNAQTFFGNFRDIFYSDKSSADSEEILVSGSSTLYSSAFVSLSVLVTLLWALVLGNVFALGTFAMFVTCTAVLGIVAMERFRNADNVADLLRVPSSAILCWFLIAEYFFYGTGHQATFPTIHWNAAFIGTGGNLYGIVIPTMLVGLNTFGSHLIVAMTLPLLIIVPFTVYAMIPTIAKLRFHVDDEMRRGEFVLFERGASFHNALFSVYGKYILLHGMRTFGCMLTTTIHCRHLMTWKIFAPKLIFQGLSFLVSLGSILASAFMIQRIDRQVKELKLQGSTKAR